MKLWALCSLVINLSLMAHKQIDYAPIVAKLKLGSTPAIEKATNIALLNSMFAVDKINNMLVINYLVKELVGLLPVSLTDKVAKINEIELYLAVLLASLASLDDGGGDTGGGSSGPAKSKGLLSIANIFKTAGPTSFYLSLVPGEADLQLGYAGIAPRSPIIGFYDPAGYKVRKPLAIIKLTPELFKHIVTNEVSGQVSDIADSNLEVYLDIWGPFISGDLPAETINNIAFHEILSKWTRISRPNLNILGGLFEPSGVTIAGVRDSIPEGTLGEFNVNYHDDCWSPNNARFKLNDGRNIVSFWLIGRYETHAVATLNLIINSGVASPSGDLGSRLMYAIERALNLNELTNFLNRESYKDLRSATRAQNINPNIDLDIETVWKFTDVLERIIA